MDKIAILGGTGFIGRQLIEQLASKQQALITASRQTNPPNLPATTIKQVDIHQLDQLTELLNGCSAVINLVGILNGSAQQFDQAHHQLVNNMIAACKENGIHRVIHISALNASPQGPSNYLQSKAKGEQALRDSGLSYTILQPSVVFGAEDQFLNRFKQLLKFSPMLPLAKAHSRFAPVFVGDVVQAITICLRQENTIGHTYELCGPKVYSLQELVQKTAQWSGKRRWIMPISDRIAYAQATLFEYLPSKPLTRDNLRSLEQDSVCQVNGLNALGIIATNLESVAPQYLA